MAETVRIQLLIRGNLPTYLRRLPEEYKKSVTSVIIRKAVSLKKALRRNVVRAGLGMRLSNAIRHSASPRRGQPASFSAEGRVFSRATVRRSGGEFDLLAILDEGTTIRARNSRFLAIPTEATGRRTRPGQYPRGSLFIRPTREGGVLASVRDPDTVLFVLVRQATIRPRNLRIEPTVDRQLRNTNLLIARDMERRATRLARRLTR